MTRSIRVEFDGAVYHVMALGNERRAIFGTKITQVVKRLERQAAKEESLARKLESLRAHDPHD